MKHTMKRVLSLVLALCLVLGLVVLLDATEVRADNAESTCATEVYTHAMDEFSVSEGRRVPSGWTKRVGYFSNHEIQSDGNRKYYELRNGATANSTADIYYALAENQVGTKMSLKYDFMVDNSNEKITDSWLVQLPTFTAGTTTRVVNLMVKDYQMNIGNSAPYFKTLEAGRWYEIEIVLDVTTGAAVIYVDQEQVHSYTAASNQDITRLSMGLQHGGDFNANYVGFAVDDLAVYDHSACASATGSFAAASYDVNVGKTVATALTLQPENAAVEYRSSNPAVATVDANGVVTGVAPGTVVITAKAKGCGLPAFASTTVEVSALPVLATVGGQEYTSVQEAVDAAVENGGTVVLQRSTTDIITVAEGKTLVLDLNGHTVGEIVANGTLYGIDTTTKNYTAAPSSVKVSGSGTVVPFYEVDDGGKAYAYAGYAAKVDEDGYATFNYFELKITNVTLRPGDAGIGYKLYLAGNENVKAMLNAEDAFGVRVYLEEDADDPNSGAKGYASAIDFQVGDQTKMVMIKNILSVKPDKVADNPTNLDKKICVEAYMQIGDEKVRIAYTDGMSLREVLVAVDATVGSLDDVQKGELVKMYQTYDLGNTDYELVIPNIKGLVPEEAK